MMESRSRSTAWSLRFLILCYSDAIQCPSCLLNPPITILSPQPTTYPTCPLNPTPVFTLDQFPKSYKAQKIREPELPVGNSQLPEPPLFSTLFCASISQLLTSIPPSPRVPFSGTYQLQQLSPSHILLEQSSCSLLPELHCRKKHTLSFPATSAKQPR